MKNDDAGNAGDSVREPSMTPGELLRQKIRAKRAAEPQLSKKEVELLSLIIRLEKECDVSVRDASYQQGLHDRFSKDSPDLPAQWLRKIFSEDFRCLNRRPVWDSLGPRWPFELGMPMYYVGELSLTPGNPVLPEGCRLLLFAASQDKLVKVGLEVLSLKEPVYRVIEAGARTAPIDYDNNKY